VGSLDRHFIGSISMKIQFSAPLCIQFSTFSPTGC
jgi:hypothetical protein